MKMRLLDRYIIREIIPPFLLGLLVFTFVLIIPFIIDISENLITKGVPAVTILQLAATLLPATVSLTIPMALLIGILVALGRLSADREVVVMMACGVSPYRMLSPIMLFAVVCWGATSWLMIKGMPDGNQRFREITQEIVMDRAEGEVRPNVFFEDFPKMVLYVREVPVNGKGWVDVLAADTSNPSQPIIYFAKRGRMLVDRQAKTVQMVLEEGTRHTTKVGDPTAYEVAGFKSSIMTLDPESVFPREGPARGDRELAIEDLAALAADLRARGESPHNQIIEIHKKFSVPIACFVFAILGLALGASNRKSGKLAALVLGIGVVFAYYVIMVAGTALVKGGWIPAWMAMWLPDILLGAAGVALLVARVRSADQPIRIPLPLWFARKAAADTPVAAHAQAQADATAPGRRRVVLVIRVPQFDLPRPTLLDSYVANLYLRILAITISGILGLFYISSFLDLSDKLFKGQTTLGMMLGYLFWSTPQFLTYIIALSILLAALVTVGLLTKNSELIVMRACGISLYRTALPMVALAIAGGAVLFGIEETVLATANRRAEQLQHIIRTGSPQTFGLINRQWIVGKNGEIYHYQFYDPRTESLNSLSVFRFDERDHTLRSRTFAQRAIYSPAGPDGATVRWSMSDGWSREFGPKMQDEGVFEAFDRRVAPLEAPEYFVTEARQPDLMNFGQLKAYIAELRASGYNVLEHEVGLHRKVAFPFVTIVMTLIAVPFAVSTGRRGAMYGIGVGIVLALLYWTMISVFAAFGVAGLIDPWLAAWAPNLIFGAAAAYLLLTVRT